MKQTPSSSQQRKTNPKTKVRRGAKGKRDDICFVICPFGGWNDRYYEDVYSPAVEGAGLRPRRADDLYRPSAIVHDIWALVKKSRVMLADVTGKNPNVFYELGLAHALGKPVVIVTKSMDDVPFDLRALRVIEFNVEDPEWSEILEGKIKQSIGEVLASPEEAVPPAFLKEKKVSSQPSVTPGRKDILRLQQEMDRLRAEVRSKGHVSEIISGPEEATSILERYVRGGMPEKIIVSRLERRGVPHDWIVDKLKQLTPTARHRPARFKNQPRDD